MPNPKAVSVFQRLEATPSTSPRLEAPLHQAEATRRSNGIVFLHLRGGPVRRIRDATLLEFAREPYPIRHRGLSPASHPESLPQAGFGRRTDLERSVGRSDSTSAGVVGKR